MTQTQIPQTPQTQTPREIIIPYIHMIKVFKFWHRQGPSYIDEQEIRAVAIKGKTMYSIFDEYAEEYPYRRGGKVAIIPTNETDVIAIRVKRDNNTVDPEEHSIEYYVYIRGFGWWRFANNDAVRVNPDNVPAEKISDVREIQEDDFFI